MRIKKLTIHGFKAFRDKTVIDDFSKANNVFIGRNGTGKTTIFDALSFVLSDTHTNLTRPQRQSLIHNGGGHRVMTAYVEIVFDNTDKRLHIDTEEVVLRRTVGMKKDEYFLNRKRFARADVMRMLENAGFSRSNPYYIVKQNQAKHLANMSDEARLQVLKEVAGTQVYDQRRQESMKILRETDGKLGKIEEVIAQLETRIGELDEEKEELSKYLDLDRARRALEHRIATDRLERSRASLEKYSEAQAENADKSAALRDRLGEVEGALGNCKKLVDEARRGITKAKTDKKEFDRRHRSLLKRRKNLELRVKRLRVIVETDANDAAQNAEELASVQKRIAEATADLEDTVLPQLRAAQAEARRTKQERVQADRDQRSLLAKQGRQRQFKTKKARDAHLTRKIKGLDKELHNMDRTLAIDRRNVDECRDQIARVKKRLKTIRANDDICNQQSTRARADESKLVEKRKKLLVLEKEAQRALDKIESAMVAQEEAKQRARSALDKTKSLALKDGLAAIKSFCEEHDITGVHGPLIELFGTKKASFMTAVEVTANNQLFHVVVDTDETAARLVKYLEEGHKGRVTFMPLNRLNPQRSDARERDRAKRKMGDRALPLITLLEFAPMYEPAMQQVFGQTLLCKDDEVATEFSREFNMDCVTIDGSQVNRRGGMRGGYVDAEDSRLASFGAYTEASDALADLRDAAKKAEERVRELSQELTQATGELQQAESRRGEAQESHNRLVQELTKTEESLRRKSTRLEELDRTVAEREASRQVKQTERNTLVEEQASPFTSTLSEAEQRTLQTLDKKVASLRADEDTAAEALAKVSQKHTQLKALLDDNLMRRRAELKQVLSVDAGGVGNYEAAQHVEELATKEQELVDTRDAEDAAQAEHSKASTLLRAELLPKMTKLEDNKRAHEDEHEELTNELEALSKSMNKLANKVQMAESKREEAMRKLREMHTVPAEEERKLTGLAPAELHKKLQRVNNHLKKFSHVNKKAIDQFSSFSEQRERLFKRKSELDEGKASIEKLIKNLDMKKDEAILRTFKQVSLHFKEVFHELAPEAEAKLVMVTDTATEGGSPARRHRGAKQDVSTFRGVKLEAWFGAGGQSARSFSGGQQTLIALSLVCAIQRCDPAPFYVFDEVDEALDPQAAEAVGRLFVKQAAGSGDGKGAQVFTISHNEAVVKRADKAYGLSFKGKQSTVQVQSKREALAFVRAVNKADRESMGAQPATKRRRAGAGGAGAGSDEGESGRDEGSFSDESSEASDAAGVDDDGDVRMGSGDGEETDGGDDDDEDDDDDI